MAELFINGVNLEGELICNIMSLLSNEKIARISLVSQNWRASVQSEHFLKVYIPRARNGPSCKSGSLNLGQWIGWHHIKYWRFTPIHRSFEEFTYPSKVWIVDTSSLKYVKMGLSASNNWSMGPKKNSTCLILSQDNASPLISTDCTKVSFVIMCCTFLMLPVSRSSNTAEIKVMGFEYNAIANDYQLMVLLKLSLQHHLLHLSYHSLKRESWTMLAQTEIPSNLRFGEPMAIKDVVVWAVIHQWLVTVMALRVQILQQRISWILCAFTINKVQHHVLPLQS